MLFSNPEVASFMSERFACAWESVRPVPKVEIDFGDGRLLKRTLHGNVVTYLCTPEGKVFDVLPGLHSPEGYLDGLRRGLDLYETMRSSAETPADARPHLAAGSPVVEERSAAEKAAAFEAAIVAYHALEASGVSAVAVFAGGRVGPAWRIFASKARVETPLKVLLSGRTMAPEEALRLHGDRLAGLEPLGLPATSAPSKIAIERPVERAVSRARLEEPFAPGTDAVALLAMDTRINERLRKEKVHRFLAKAPLPAPGEIRSEVYRDVFGLDLEDPYLGLAPILFDGAEDIPE